MKGIGNERQTLTDQIGGKKSQEGHDAERQPPSEVATGMIGSHSSWIGPEIRDPTIQVPPTRNPRTKKVVDPGHAQVVASTAVPTTRVTATTSRRRLGSGMASVRECSLESDYGRACCRSSIVVRWSRAFRASITATSKRHWFDAPTVR